MAYHNTETAPILEPGTNITMVTTDKVITISASGGGGTTTNAVTFNNSNTGDASGTTFDGSAARTISANTLGAWSLIATGQSLGANLAFAGSNANRLTFNFTTLGASSGVTINSTATDAASNTQKAFEVLQSGANGTSTQTTYGGYFSNTKTGTSSTNVGLYATASGGTTNYGLLVASGLVGINTLTPTATLQAKGRGTTTSELFRLDDSASTNRLLVLDSGTSTLTGKMSIVGTSLSGSSVTDNWLNITGTFPTGGSTNTYGVYFLFTGAGTGTGSQQALRVEHAAGYTGSVTTAAINAILSAAGTNTVAPTMGTIYGNAGYNARTVSTTTGHNYGGQGQASGGNLNVGVIGQAQTDKASATNYGVVGLSRNAGASGVQVGGYFGLLADATALQTTVGGALIADNGATTSPIVRLMDNTSTIWLLADGGAITHTGKYAITGSSLSGSSSTDNWLNITATFPTTLTSTGIGVNFEFTTAGSSSQIIAAQRIALLAGYTGSFATSAGNFNNQVAGTNTTAPTMGTLVGNIGSIAQSGSTTTGHNYGLFGHAFGGDRSVGVMGQAQTAKNSATNIGVVGLGRNTGTSPIHVGGYFGLNADATFPTLTSAALIADNSDRTADIFLARDNGTAVWSIADDGNTTWADGINMVFNTTTGTKIGTTTSQKIGLWNTTPDVQPTTAITAAAFVANTSGIINDTATWGGYTGGKIVAALKRIGALA
jgi:hypothetical protein